MILILYKDNDFRKTLIREKWGSYIMEHFVQIPNALFFKRDEGRFVSGVLCHADKHYKKYGLLLIRTGYIKHNLFFKIFTFVK